MEKRETAGDRLRRVREARGLSRAKLGRFAGVDDGAIYQVETGRRQGFLDETWERLAAVLDVSAAYLKYGREFKDGAEYASIALTLRHTSSLTEGDIASVEKIIRALELQQHAEQLQQERHERDAD